MPLNATDKDEALTTSLGSLLQCLITFTVKIFFHNVQSETPLMQFCAIPVCTVTSHQREEIRTSLSIPLPKL